MSTPTIQPEDAAEPLPTAETPTGGASRMRYLDSLRGTLMLLGIVIHTSGRFGEHRQAMAGGWEGWSTLGGFIHLWRMPAFFMIAGFFAVMVLSRRDVGQWWRRRVVRLGLPLLFGVYVVNSFLWPAKASMVGLLEGRGLQEVWDDVVVPRVGELAHLWFLVHLLIYCTILAALTWVVRRWDGRPNLRGHAVRLVTRPWVVVALLAPVVVLSAWAVHAAVVLPVEILGLRVKSSLLPFTGAFVVGALLGLAPGALARLVEQLAWWMLLPALVLPVLILGPSTMLLPGSWARAFAVVGAGYAWTFVLLAVFRRVADRGGWLTRYIIDASLPVYLVHLPVIFFLAGFFTAEGHGPVVAGLMTMAATVVICFAIYELLNLVTATRWLSTGRGERGTSVRELLPGAGAGAGASRRTGWVPRP